MLSWVRAGKAILPAFVSLAPGMAASAGASQAPAPHARVELVAAAGAIAPGRDLWLGIHFVLEPGWHIYWQNPGDSGGPPTVQWRLPDGLAAGELEWPLPERIEAGASIVNYGYEGEVVLPVRLRATGGWTQGGATVAALVKYVICRDICVPGRADVELAVPVPAASQARLPAWRGLIESARAHVPRPAPASWRATATAATGRITLLVETGRAEPVARFLPLVPGQIEDEAPAQVTAVPRGVRFVLRQSDQAATPPASLRGVVVLADGRAFTVDAPLKSAR